MHHRIHKTIFTGALSLTLFAGCSHKETAQDPRDQGVVSMQVEYDSNQLMMKSADDISFIVRKKIKRAQDIQNRQVKTDDESVSPEEAAVRQLKDATRIVMARPDQDGTRAAAFLNLRRELQDVASLDQVLSDLAAEGIFALRTPTVTIRRQSTYLVILENLIAELRPESSTNAEFKKIIQKIADANLKVSDGLRSQVLLNSMAKPVSPSETAKAILARDAKKKP